MHILRTLLLKQYVAMNRLGLVCAITREIRTTEVLIMARSVLFAGLKDDVNYSKI